MIRGFVWPHWDGRLRVFGVNRHCEDKVALLANLARWKGKLDGFVLSPNEPQINELVSAPKQDWTDTLELDGTIEENADIHSSQAQPDAVIPPGLLHPCDLQAVLWTATPVCARWAPEGFRDIGVSSSIPSEDYTLEDRPHMLMHPSTMATVCFGKDAWIIMAAARLFTIVRSELKLAFRPPL